MRQVVIQVPRGRGQWVLEVAARNNAANAAVWSAQTDSGQADMALAWMPNDRVEPLLAELQQEPELRVTLSPRGDIPLRPPQGEAPDQAMDVRPLSPLEVFLSGLQSVGSWRAFLTYALAAGIVVWIGLYTNTVYLLVAAMLIAPYAGPAMNAAIATARGDGRLLVSSLARYLSGLAVAVAVSAALSWAFGLSTPTRLTTDVAVVSATTLVLSTVAGAAGAVSLVQSERNSLVSGAAVGMLVAASLAPPAGIIGMYAVMGRWDAMLSGLYLLLNQLVGLNLAGALVFLAYGLTPRGARYSRGRPWLSWTALVVSATLLAGLAAWQLAAPPSLQRSDIEQRAEAEVARVMRESGLAVLAEKRITVTGQQVGGLPALLVEVYAVPRRDLGLSDSDAAGRLTAALRERLTAKDWGVAPLVRVTMLDGP